MKQLIIICSMLACAGMASAQTTAMSEGTWEGNDNHYHRAAAQPANEFESLQMEYSDGKATFSGMPTLKRATWAILTNSTGEYIKQMKLTPEENVMDVHRLHEGLYFITIIYRNKSKKAFTLNL